MNFSIYTSIYPKMARTALGQEVSVDYQRECIGAWVQAGFDVVSLNNTVEASDVAHAYPQVRTVCIDGKKPRIVDFINTAIKDKQPAVGFVNSDCLYIGDLEMADRLRAHALEGMVLFERLNLDPEAFQILGRTFGFDGFFFRTDLLSSLKMDNTMQIGDAWWDYMFPLSFREAGGVLYQTSPTLLHLNHPVVWNIENNLSGALKAKDVFAGKFGLSSSELNDEESIDAYAEQFFNCVRNSATYVSLRGISLSARMIDQLTVELRRNIDTTYDREQVVSRAVESYRRSRPSSKIAGEFLCTMSRALCKIGLGTNLANWLFQLGDDLQFGARKDVN